MWKQSKKKNMWAITIRYCFHVSIFYKLNSIDINSFNKTFIASYSHVYIELQVQWNSELNMKKKEKTKNEIRRDWSNLSSIFFVAIILVHISHRFWTFNITKFKHLNQYYIENYFGGFFFLSTSSIYRTITFLVEWNTDTKSYEIEISTTFKFQG